VATFYTDEFKWAAASKSFIQDAAYLGGHPFHDLGQGQHGLILVNNYSDVGVFTIDRCFSDVKSKKVTVSLSSRPVGSWFDAMGVVVENMNQDWFM